MAKKKPNGRGGPREGSGRPIENAEGKTVALTTSVPQGLVADLRVRADREGWNMSRAVTEAIRAFVARKKR